MFELKKYRGAMIDGTKDWCQIWRTCAFQNDMSLENFYTLKNSDFILENKMAELNRNQNLKQLDWPDAVRKRYFTLKINE